MFRRKPSEASLQQAERRQREDQAPRLIDEVPSITSLRLRIEESRGESTIAEAGHVRPVVVASAPALFEFPCGDKSCKGGGHDFTNILMQRLRAKDPQFEGDHACEGSLGSAEAPCNRVMRVIATATYE
jgi:hypothetical protein